MKKLFIALFAFGILSVSANAQMVTYKDNKNIDIPNSVQMCQIEIHKDLIREDESKNAFWFEIDYGRLGTAVDEKGDKLYFKTIIGAYNHMVANGWEYLSGDIINNDLGRDKHSALFQR